MRIGLALSLGISILLIGGALFVRLSSQNKIEPNLAAITVDNSAQDASQDDLANFLPAATSSPANIDAPTKTDLIGRGLLSDYLTLTASGEDDPAAVTDLANRYVGTVESLNKPTTFDFASLKVVPDSEATFLNYSDQFNQIYREHAQTIDSSASGIQSFDLDPKLYALMSTFSVSYDQAAKKLEAIQVPESLSSYHLAMINLFLSSAAATKAVSNANADPAAAFSGLVTWKNNMEAEGIILSYISQILAKNGI